MVITNLTANRKNYGAKRTLSKIKYIVLHYTANDGDKAYSNALYFLRNVVNASAHYFVDDNLIYQSVPDDYVAYSVGGARYSDYKTTGGAKYYGKVTNANSISIEMCDTSKDGQYMASEKTQELAAELTRALMAKYNIPVENVVRHFDVNGKHCPLYFMDDEKWAGFKARLTDPTVDLSLVFNPTYYASRYPDLKAAGLTTEAQLRSHFVNHGMSEARQGIDTFNVLAYKNRYADLQAAFGEDLPRYYYHYCTNGFKEGRNAL